jgi:uncharacterized protein YndB with AHSA1/START domain
MNKITVQAVVNAPIEKVWECWTQPEHIKGWAFAGDWKTPLAENDLKAGGRFKTRMESADGSEGFDLTGTYTAVEPSKLIEYDMDASEGEEERRHVKTVFEQTPEGVKVTQTFDPENINSEEFQKAGWQSILDNFKSYTENLAKE